MSFFFFWSLSFSSAYVYKAHILVFNFGVHISACVGHACGEEMLFILVI